MSRPHFLDRFLDPSPVRCLVCKPGISCAELSTKGAVALSMTLSALAVVMLILACGRSRYGVPPLYTSVQRHPRSQKGAPYT